MLGLFDYAQGREHKTTLLKLEIRNEGRKSSSGKVVSPCIANCKAVSLPINFPAPLSKP